MDTKTAEDFFISKDYKNALRLYLEEVEENPDNAITHQRIGECYCLLKMYDEAFSTSKKAIELDSTLIFPRLTLVYVYAVQGDTSKALAEAKTAYGLAPEIEDVSNSYGALLLSNGLVEESIVVLRDTLKDHPNSLLVQQNLAAAYKKNKDYQNHAKQRILLLKSEPTLSNAFQLFIAYQQKYAFILALIIFGSLIGAYIIKSNFLLILPALFSIQSLLIDLEYIIRGRWKQDRNWGRFVFMFIADCVVGLIVYLVFRTIST